MDRNRLKASLLTTGCGWACQAALVCGCVGLSSGAAVASDPLPAFPGAGGAGALVTGGRGGVVYHVTVLDRNFSHNEPGTLRYGLDNANFAPNTPRTIVFDVAGAFWLGRFGAEQGHNNGWDTQSRLNLGSDVTIAGQTAPGPVHIMGGVVKANRNNVILRNVTIAPGYGMRSFEKPDEDPPVLPTPGDFPDSYVYDAIDISSQGLMIDHVSTFYATDETISANELARDVTIQYSNIAQAQNYPQADAEGSGVRYTGHALGSLLQAGSNAQISVHSNLYAHLKGRLPRVGSEEGSGAINDFRNNVFYNWLGTAGSGGGSQPSKNNFIHNFYLAGPGGDDVSQLPGPDGQLRTADDIGIVVSESGGTGIFGSASGAVVFALGNQKDVNKDGDPFDVQSATYSAGVLGAVAYNVPAGATLPAAAAYDHVLRTVGARWWERDYDVDLGNVAAIDTVDERIVHETATGTGKIVAWADDPFNDDPNEGVEWRSMLALRANPTTGAAPFARPAGWDVDLDGMPGYWEQRHGLDPTVANHNADFDQDGFTDLEDYLNDVAAWPAPGVVRWTGNDDRYALLDQWRVTGETIPIQGLGPTVSQSSWQPTRYDEAVIAAGRAVVDAPGQHAGDLHIASLPGEHAMLAVVDGWLKASNGIVIGDASGGPATLSLTGGVLFTPALTKEAGGTFDFSGGQLTARTVGFDLEIQGGRLSPAAIGDFDATNQIVTVSSELGVTQIAGHLLVHQGMLDLQIAGTGVGETDRVAVDGELQAGGTLRVSLLDGFLPQSGDAFDLLDYSTASGAFLFDLPTLPGGLAWDATALLSDGLLAVVQAGDADFDDDLQVGGSDLLVWQRNWPAASLATNDLGDADGNGTVDRDDLLAWQALFGSPGIGAQSEAASIPEPAAWAVFAAGLLTLYISPLQMCRGAR